MSILDLQGLELPSWGRGGCDHDGHRKHKTSRKRNKSCWSNCKCCDD